MFQNNLGNQLSIVQNQQLGMFQQPLLLQHQILTQKQQQLELAKMQLELQNQRPILMNQTFSQQQQKIQQLTQNQQSIFGNLMPKQDLVNIEEIQKKKVKTEVNNEFPFKQEYVSRGQSTTSLQNSQDHIQLDIYRNQISNKSDSETFDINKSLRCEKHPDMLVTAVCLSKLCIKNKLNCSLCLKQYHNSHNVEAIDEYMKKLPQQRQNIEMNVKQESVHWDNIMKYVDLNVKQLKELEGMVVRLSKNAQKMQRALGLVKDQQLANGNKLQNKIQNLMDKNKSDCQVDTTQISQIVYEIEKYDYSSIREQSEIDDIINFNKKLMKYTDEQSQSQSFQIYQSQDQIEKVMKKFTNTDFTSIKDTEKEKSSSQKIQQLSQIFHCVKGQAKKRDIINFVTWNEVKQEIKFMKDIKEKEEKSHYQLVFTLYLKNIETLDTDQINEDFMNWLRKKIMEIYPLVKQEKESQRRNGNLKQGNKRRYCKLDFKFDIDSKSYLLCNSPVASEQNLQL